MYFTVFLNKDDDDDDDDDDDVPDSLLWRHEKLSGILCEHLSDIWLSSLEIDAAQLCRNRAATTALEWEQKRYPVCFS